MLIDGVFSFGCYIVFYSASKPADQYVMALTQPPRSTACRHSRSSLMPCALMRGSSAATIGPVYPSNCPFADLPGCILGQIFSFRVTLIERSEKRSAFDARWNVSAIRRLVDAMYISHPLKFSSLLACAWILNCRESWLLKKLVHHI